MTKQNDKPEYEKPRLTFLGVLTFPIREGFKAFVSGVRFFANMGTRVSDLTPLDDERSRKVAKRRRDR